MVLTNFAGVNTTKKKTTKGRKKIEIKKIEETNSRQVTFSKRRTGLFKKASELCILTGAQLAVLVNSPGGRVYAFGHPNIDHLLDRYLKTNSSENTVTHYYPVPPTNEFNFNQHYLEVSKELEAEKKRNEMILASGCGLPWFDEPVEGFPVEELEQYLWSLVELKKKVVTRADELMMINKSPAMLGCLNGGFTGEVPANGSFQGGGFVFGGIGRF